VRVRRAWLLTLGPIGTASLLYVFVTRGFTDPSDVPGAGLGWPLLGVLPLFVFGVWLLTVTSSRVAVYVALGATGSAVGSAYETYVWTHLEVLGSSTFALLNQVGLTADALAAIGFLLMFATFPDGLLEQRWQRIALRFVWVGVFIGPATLLTYSQVVLPEYLGIDGPPISNPYAVPALSGLVPVVDALFGTWWILPGLALLVFYSRCLFGPPARRAQLRIMGVAVTAAILAYMFWEGVALTRFAGTPVATASGVLTAITLAALPVAGIHGILRYGAYDVGVADRGKVVVRSSNTLITLFYAVAVATPGVLLVGRLEPVSAVLLTAVLAVVLLPVRGLLQRLVRSAVFGDRDHHLTLLTELGARLEQSLELDEVLSRLAHGVGDGLDATWVRIRLVGTDGGWADTPVGVAGTVSGEAVAGQDLTLVDARLGRIELGPRRHGDYSLAELQLLETVARQATTAVANVRLNTQLAEQLEELTASRLRLITAQDAERRRIERDLHDGIQQNIVALMAGLRLARNRLDRGALRPEELTELQDQARETLADLRQLAHGIHPQVLSDNGLVAAVESRTARFPIPVTIRAGGQVRQQRFDADVETVAYYTVREALANVAKHSGATQAVVTLRHHGGRLSVEVTDDGTGFDPSEVGDGQSGVTNIRDRVAAVHGTLTVDSAIGGGTRILVDLPTAPETVPGHAVREAASVPVAASAAAAVSTPVPTSVPQPASPSVPESAAESAAESIPETTGGPRA